ncbi:prenyltransferase/squalene oxidase repeat-containing protein [Rhodopirellula sp. P2]|uniref:prenyltransferase/squalene oxidase repeat-containing protein n=1 Tax=Rhodopirellula sp. P2 TaxID=2127060 RepID=UPI0023688616|nr:prenyltransferase/squalene oxidase repeat-containing protein [Rhodopirellula sp. P2]WDQ15508.1 terpene cyclase/mutase family protein [Rhodopirellula sp. P2]
MQLEWITRTSTRTFAPTALGWIVAAAIGVATGLNSPVMAQETAVKDSRTADQRIDQMVNRGIEFLRTRGQSDEGAFSGETGAAVTGLCVRAILEHRPEAVSSDPVVVKAIQYLESKVQPDGGIYAVGSKHRNYETSTAAMALNKANQDGRFDSQLERAKNFLKDIQWDEDEGAQPSDTAYGGAGYGSHSRPDLSNTSFLIEALRDLGTDANDESIQKALLFVSRTQNLPQHGNDTAYADKVGDGGFYYTPAAGGQSQAGESADGGLRSYGSMTYAGLKSMIYAGLTPEDPRVNAALDFIRKHYTLENNPGMGAQGQYYYYHTFAKALDVAGLEVIESTDAGPRDWRMDLINKLEAEQQADGSWVNREAERWMEGDRQLVTAYCLLALKHARK